VNGLSVALQGYSEELRSMGHEVLLVAPDYLEKETFIMKSPGFCVSRLPEHLFLGKTVWPGYGSK
jgi:hypothetical protein